MAGGSLDITAHHLGAKAVAYLSDSMSFCWQGILLARNHASLSAALSNRGVTARGDDPLLNDTHFS
jgi:hypothetical protein